MCVRYRCKMPACEGELVLDEDAGLFCSVCKRPVGEDEAIMAITGLSDTDYKAAESIIAHRHHIACLKQRTVEIVGGADRERIG